jgi:hypothetical protein
VSYRLQAKNHAIQFAPGSLPPVHIHFVIAVWRAKLTAFLELESGSEG